MNMEQNEITNPMKAIKAYCLDCGDGTYNEAKNCVIKNCPLYPFRLGKNPFRAKRELTDEQKSALVARLRNSGTEQA